LTLAESIESLGAQARVVIDLRRGVLGFGDDGWSRALGLLSRCDGARCWLSVKQLGAAFLGFGRHAPGLFVGPRKSRRSGNPGRS
jgi:hypothetical protein